MLFNNVTSTPNVIFIFIVIVQRNSILLREHLSYCGNEDDANNDNGYANALERRALMERAGGKWRHFIKVQNTKGIAEE